MTRQPFSAFRDERKRLQERLERVDHLGVKRFLSLDSGAYRDSATDRGLPADTKELIGLVASLVLRCDDCVNYHLEQCVNAGYTHAQIVDAMNVGLVVGGSIVIPHLRRALVSLDELIAERGAGEVGKG